MILPTQPLDLHPLRQATLTTQPDGTPISELRYTASGEPPTGYRYTGQLSKLDTTGLYYYGARWYDPYLNRMLSPDSIVPDPYNPLDWDRYSYARNNPIKYTDPSGHAVACATDAGNGCAGFGPSTIVKAGFDPEKTNEYLRKFMESRPDYRVEKDPLIYGKNEEQLVRTAQFQVEAEKPLDLGDWTLQVGRSDAVYAGMGIRMDIFGAVDGKGNMGLFISFGGGGYSALGASVGPFIGTTNAPSIDKLIGPSLQVGGQVGEAAYVSGEYDFFRDSETGEIYSGPSISTGNTLTLPWPGVLYGTGTNTWAIWYRPRPE